MAVYPKETILNSISAPPLRRLTRRGVQRRKELMSSAMALFAEHGYDGTTTKAIADHCRVTEAVIFRYFPTKQALFREVVAEYSAPLHYEMPYEDFRSRPFEEALKSLFSGYLDNCWEHRQSMRLFLLATFHDEAILEKLSALFEFRRRRLGEMIDERIAAGEIRPEFRGSAGDIITLAVTGFSVRVLRAPPQNWVTARDKFLIDLVRVVAAGLRSSS